VSEDAVNGDDKETNRTFAVKSLKMVAAFCSHRD
jgi:hypothetical protein